MKNEADPIMLEIMSNALQSVVDEMTATLIRTAYSPNIKDRIDCSCALLTSGGEVVAQTEFGTPFHLATMPAAAATILRKYPLEDLSSGDSVAMNVPYPTGPGHLSDVTLLRPFFSEERRSAFW